MRNAVVGTNPIDGMGACGLALAGVAEAVDKLLAVVSEDRGDHEGSVVDQALEETTGSGC